MNAKKVTLKQIAAAAGLAISTVSQILNGRRNFCSAEQVARVRDLARETGYSPNIGYKIMTGQKTQTTGLIFSQARTYFQDDTTREAMMLISALEKLGESVYAVTMGSSAEDNINQIRNLINRGCCAFVFLGSPIGSQMIFDELERLKLNCVSLNNIFSPRDIHYDTWHVYRSYFQRLHDRGIDRFNCLMPNNYFEGY